MDYDLLFPGRFLKSGQFKGREITLTIHAVRVEELPQENGKPRGRGVLSFVETKMELVLNRTNGECIKAMFGRETDAWLGKRVTFFPAKIEAFGAHEQAIRVRGSPDIAKDIAVEVQLPRRKPVRVTLKRIAKANGKKAAAPVEAAPDAEPEEMDPVTGEVPLDNGHALAGPDDAPF